MENHGKHISGFYYDEQKKQRELTVTLHPNTMINEDGEWEDIRPVKYSCLDPLSAENPHSGNYRKEPIATSFLREDFQVDIDNSWSNHDGGNAIESLWNAAKPLAPYASKIGGALSKMTAETKKESNDEYFGSSIVKGLNSVFGGVGKGLSTVGNYLDRQLIIQGTRFSYYSGTSTSFGSLVMRYTIFANWVENKETGEYEFKTVNEQLEDLLPYAVGEYKVITEREDINKLVGEEIGGAIGDVTDLFAWQLPPAGFNSSIKSIDACQRGTLRMNFGSLYAIENLVVKNLGLNFSKVQTKDPREIGTTTPLYCEVTLTMQPASMYTDQALSRFIKGKGLSSIKKELAEKNKKKLESELANWSVKVDSIPVSPSSPSPISAEPIRLV